VAASVYVLLAGVEVGEVSVAFGAVKVVDCLLFNFYVEDWVKKLGFEGVTDVAVVHLTIVVVSVVVVVVVVVGVKGVRVGDWSEVEML